jgi:hypothetical protein
VKPPSLKLITEESVEIIADLEYGINETMPEFWQVQYKEVCPIQNLTYLPNFSHSSIILG